MTWLRHTLVFGLTLALPANADQPKPPGNAPPVAPIPGAVLSLDGDGWLLATDPKNTGDKGVGTTTRKSGPSRPRCPGSSRRPFPAITAWPGTGAISPPRPTRTPGGRYLLRFWAVDYLADVWLNGVHVGRHEGGEDALRAGRDRRGQARGGQPAGRPRAQPDATSRSTASCWPRRRTATRRSPTGSGALQPRRHHRLGRAAASSRRCASRTCSSGPTRKTGDVRVQASVRNAGRTPVAGADRLRRRPGRQRRDARRPRGSTASCRRATRWSRPTLRVDHPRLWQLNDPYLYRVTARVRADGSRSRSTSSRRAAASATSASPTATSASTAGACTCGAPTRATTAPSACSCPTIPTCCAATCST